MPPPTSAQKPDDDDATRRVDSPARRRPLPMPHERDESIDLEGEVGHEVIEQAKRDLDAGQVDTDLRQTPGLDADRRQRLLRRR